MAFTLPTYARATLRVIQAIFGIIVLGLTAYMVSFFNFSPTVNFMLFNGVWTPFFAVPFLAVAPMYFPSVAQRIVVLAAEVITMIFWFAGFIALATLLPSPHYCYDACNSAQAAVVFGALEWALFAATTGIAVMGLLSSKDNNSTKPAPHAQAQTANTINPDVEMTAAAP